MCELLQLLRWESENTSIVTVNFEQAKAESRWENIPANGPFSKGKQMRKNCREEKAFIFSVIHHLALGKWKLVAHYFTYGIGCSICNVVEYTSTWKHPAHMQCQFISDVAMHGFCGHIHVHVWRKLVGSFWINNGQTLKSSRQYEIWCSWGRKQTFPA